MRSCRKVLHGCGGERGEAFLCVQLSVCFGSREGLRAFAAVPEEQLVSSGVLFMRGPSAQPVTDTGTC